VILDKVLEVHRDCAGVKINGGRVFLPPLTLPPGQAILEVL